MSSMVKNGTRWLRIFTENVLWLFNGPIKNFCALFVSFVSSANHHRQRTVQIILLAGLLSESFA
jgi:hypothetical protein